MSLVYRCDRCGYIFSSCENCCKITEHRPESYNIEEYHLCQDCAKEFKEFMKYKED